MKCIELLSDSSYGWDGDIIRVSNEDAADLVNAGEAFYVSKADWKAGSREAAYRIAEYEAVYGVRFPLEVA